MPEALILEFAGVTTRYHPEPGRPEPGDEPKVLVS